MTLAYKNPEIRPAPRFYRPELDILRFVAFFLVFLRHTGASIAGEMHAAGGLWAFMANLSAAGSYGVDLFFLLSAYLITELFMREIDRHNHIDIRAFYIRRILRIWPLYFSFIFVVFVASHFVRQIQFPNGAAIALIFFYGNWYLMTHAFFSPAGILWSVSIEEQFYLCCPIAVRFLSRTGLIALALLLILMAIAARFVLLSAGGNLRSSYVWYNTVTRLDPIAIGILVSLLLRGRKPMIAPAARAALVAIGLICLYGAATWLHGMEVSLSVIDGMLAYPLADIGVLVIFVAFLGAPIAWRPFIFLGQISYGLYVFHLFGLDVAKIGLLHFTGACPFWLRGLIGLAMTIGLASLSYSWLERPFLRLKSRSRA